MRYSVSSKLSISVTTFVEAESFEEAAQIAIDRDVVRLCPRCGGDEEDAEKKWILQNGLKGQIEEEMQVIET